MTPKESVINMRVKDLIFAGIKAYGVRGLAKKTELSPAIITRYSQGKVGEPSVATLQKLAKYSGLSLSWLRGDLGAMENGGIDFNAIGSVAVCAKCGSHLEQDSSSSDLLKLWPCPVCCKGK